jgi:hypothetical protein
LKIWRIALVSLLAVGLVLGVASPALAAPPWVSPPSAEPPPPPRVIRGEVVSTEANTAFVVQSGWFQVRVLVNEDTQYFKASLPGAISMPLQPAEKPAEPGSEGLGLRQRLQLLVEGVLSRVPALVRNRLEVREQVRQELRVAEGLRPFAEEADFSDIEAGSQVVVWAASGEDDPVAERVVIIEPVTYLQVVGTIDIIDTAAKTITIEPADGGSDVILSYDDETRFVLRGRTSLEVGESVRAVYDEAGIARLVIVVIDSD